MESAICALGVSGTAPGIPLPPERKAPWQLRYGWFAPAPDVANGAPYGSSSRIKAPKINEYGRHFSRPSTPIEDRLIVPE